MRRALVTTGLPAVLAAGWIECFFPTGCDTERAVEQLQRQARCSARDDTLLDCALRRE